MNTSNRLTADRMAELQLLSLFPLETMLEGLQVHHTAGAATVNAAHRLHEKGLVTDPDGGYLTDLGRTAAEHLQALLAIVEA